MKALIPLVLIASYLGFLAWWFLRNDSSQSSRNSQRVARTVVVAPKSPQVLSKSPSHSEAKRSLVKQKSPVLREHAPSSTHIRADELPSFKPYPYPGGQPYYPGEKTTAYVRVPSTGKQEAMTVNQGGEYPRLLTKPGETVQIRLAFTETPPETPIALTAQDGGLIEGKQKSTVGWVDSAGQLAFAYSVSNNAGMHRVTVGTPSGETKTLEFWVEAPQ
jgi:hypothetical protein